MIEIRKVFEKEEEEAVRTACDIFFSEQEVLKELTVIPPELSPVWYGAFSENELIGTIAAYKEKNEQHMGRLTVKESMRGRRIATKLVETVLAELFEEGETEVFLDAREATKKIILSFGGEVIGKDFPFFKSICTPVKITKEQFERKHGQGRKSSTD